MCNTANHLCTHSATREPKALVIKQIQTKMVRFPWCSIIFCFVVVITRTWNVESFVHARSFSRKLLRHSAAKSNSGFGDGSNRRRTEEKRSEPISSPAKKGFGISSKSSLSSSSASSSKTKKLIDPGTVLKGTSQQNMENTIQTAIDSHEGLREVMALQNELDDWKVSMTSMTDTDKSRITTAKRNGRKPMHEARISNTPYHQPFPLLSIRTITMTPSS